MSRPAPTDERGPPKRERDIATFPFEDIGAEVERALSCGSRIITPHSISCAVCVTCCTARCHAMQTPAPARELLIGSTRSEARYDGDTARRARGRGGRPGRSGRRFARRGAPDDEGRNPESNRIMKVQDTRTQRARGGYPRPVLEIPAAAPALRRSALQTLGTLRRHRNSHVSPSAEAASPSPECREWTNHVWTDSCAINQKALRVG